MPNAATADEFQVENVAGISWRRSLPWLGLACILVAYVIVVVRLHPTTFFGYLHDDSLYFSSAKAIAEGRGYILPSVPGTPAATKYPVLYPWMLSWVWHWNSSFPDNLVDAVGLSVLFAVAFITLILIFLRRFGGISDGEALILTAFCALHPIAVFCGGNVLTDIPFAALALGAMLTADKSMRPDTRVKFALLCGVLAGLAMQIRSIGIAIIAGIAVIALIRRAWYQFWSFCASAGALTIPGVWRTFFGGGQAPQFVATSLASFGWHKAWVYYTSYLGFWRLSIPNAHVLLAMMERNAVWLIRTPSDYFLLPSLARGGVGGLTLLLVVTGLLLAGIVRQARRFGWKPIHYALPFYTMVLLLWNFNDPYRFLVPFLPLFAAGYWLETKRVLGLARQTIAGKRPATEVALACSLIAVIGAGNVAIAWNYSGGVRNMISPIIRDRRARLPAKRDAYDWISRFTPRNSRIVAYEDASLYLYTGRQAMRPITFTTAEMVEPERMQRALDHMTDVALTIGADYWLESDDDFNLDWPDAKVAAALRLDHVQHDLPLVFCSTDGRLRIYALRCRWHPEDVACNVVSRSGEVVRHSGSKRVSDTR